MAYRCAEDSYKYSDHYVLLPGVVFKARFDWNYVVFYRCRNPSLAFEEQAAEIQRDLTHQKEPFCCVVVQRTEHNNKHLTVRVMSGLCQDVRLYCPLSAITVECYI